LPSNILFSQIGEVDIHAQLLPEDKVRIVQQLKRTGVTAMVGDGINDAPALAAADVGIAMGVAGTAIAMETADVALMTNDLRKLAIAVELGQSCRWKIGQNVTLSLVTKLVIIGLAAAGYASLWTAVLADVGTCLIVIFNSMRLLKHKACTDRCCSKLQTLSKVNLHSTLKVEKICCSKPEVDMKCLESGLVELCDEAMASVPNTHRGKLQWLHTHYTQHHQKKKEADKRGSCSKANLAVETKHIVAPSCSNSRYDQGVLTPRGKSNRHNQYHSHRNLEEKHVSGTTCCAKGPSEIKKVALGCCSRLNMPSSQDEGEKRNPLISSDSRCDHQLLGMGTRDPTSTEHEGEHLTSCELKIPYVAPGNGIRRRQLGTKDNLCSSESGGGSTGTSLCSHIIEEPCVLACLPGAGNTDSLDNGQDVLLTLEKVKAQGLVLDHTDTSLNHCCSKALMKPQHADHHTNPVALNPQPPPTQSCCPQMQVFESKLLVPEAAGPTCYPGEANEASVLGDECHVNCRVPVCNTAPPNIGAIEVSSTPAGLKHCVKNGNLTSHMEPHLVPSVNQGTSSSSRSSQSISHSSSTP
jgi:hypothetical protein